VETTTFEGLVATGSLRGRVRENRSDTNDERFTCCLLSLVSSHLPRLLSVAWLVRLRIRKFRTARMTEIVHSAHHQVPCVRPSVPPLLSSEPPLE
jgi:hypothetical protein